MSPRKETPANSRKKKAKGKNRTGVPHIFMVRVRKTDCQATFRSPEQGQSTSFQKLFENTLFWYCCDGSCKQRSRTLLRQLGNYWVSTIRDPRCMRFLFSSIDHVPCQLASVLTMMTLLHPDKLSLKSSSRLVYSWRRQAEIHRNITTRTKPACCIRKGGGGGGAQQQNNRKQNESRQSCATRT